jgi:hypothetical protein
MVRVSERSDAIPINIDARKAADMWDPAKDEAAGEQCRSYGAPAIMRVPGRLHITWQDPNTLKVETDAGEQVRLLHFGKGTPTKGAPATRSSDSICIFPAQRAQNWTMIERRKHESIEFSRALSFEILKHVEKICLPPPLKKYSSSW